MLIQLNIFTFHSFVCWHKKTAGPKDPNLETPPPSSPSRRTCQRLKMETQLANDRLQSARHKGCKVRTPCQKCLNQSAPRSKVHGKISDIFLWFDSRYTPAGFNMVKRAPPRKRRFLLKPIIFRFHVNPWGWIKIQKISPKMLKSLLYDVFFWEKMHGTTWATKKNLVVFYI